MTESIVLIGVGEMGGVFARGFLRAGYPVYPVTRNVDMAAVARDIPEPTLALVAVAEADVQEILEALPRVWRTRVGLLQNELLPKDWQEYHIKNPTVISVWFEKKKGQDAKVIIPSPVYGPHASLVKTSLESIQLPCRALKDYDELVFELVRKNLYILTSNIAGLVTGGNVGELWQRNRDIASAIADDVIKIQAQLTGLALPRDKLVDAMVEAFNADPEHKCMGRTAPARLIRALAVADQLDVPVPALRKVQSNL